MTEWLRRTLNTDAPAATGIVRVLVGWVFVSEGIQKFLFADARGAGRFAKIGLPAPDVLGPFVGGVEIVCGALVLLGLLTRAASVPLVVIMLVAIATTKIPMLGVDGVWETLHASRTDASMLLASAFLITVGGGRGSVDHRLAPAPPAR